VGWDGAEGPMGREQGQRRKTGEGNFQGISGWGEGAGK